MFLDPKHRNISGALRAPDSYISAKLPSFCQINTPSETFFKYPTPFHPTAKVNGDLISSQRYSRSHSLFGNKIVRVRRWRGQSPPETQFVPQQHVIIVPRSLYYRCVRARNGPQSQTKEVLSSLYDYETVMFRRPPPPDCCLTPRKSFIVSGLLKN